MLALNILTKHFFIALEKKHQHDKADQKILTKGEGVGLVLQVKLNVLYL